MLNPISKNRSYLITFITVWVLIFGIHTFIINFFYGINGLTSLTDSAIFNGLFAIIGFNLWYVLRFNLRDSQSVFDIIVNHLIIAVVTIAIWLAVGYFSLYYMYNEDQPYIQFLNESIPWRAVTGVFYYLLFIMFYYMILYYEDLQDKLKIEGEMQTLVKEAELSALKSQINPHFLFNSLNSISSLTISDPEKAQEMVIKLSDFLRYSLTHDKDEKTSLKKEFENIDRYLAIEKVRFGHRLNFNWKVPEYCINFEIPNMILQPLIENSIKHGVYHSTEEVLIELSCKKENGFVKIEIANDYDPEATKKVGHGIGLSNIRKRLQLIYQRQDLLETIADKMIFKAILKLPVNGDNE